VNQRSWSVSAIAAGIALMLAGPLLFAVAPTQTFWTNADQAQYQKAAADFHASTFQLPAHKSEKNTPSTYDPVAAKIRYDAAKGAYEQQRARLSAAQSRPFWLSWLLRLAGIGLAAVGLYGYFAAEPSGVSSARPSATPSARPISPQAVIAQIPLPPGSSDVVTIDGAPPKIEV
jgi:hypothetical protein